MEAVLIVASSGRMLAQAAKKCGLIPLVIDLFADLDMQRYAADFRQVTSLNESDLAEAIDYFIKRYAVTRAIYGSGFEAHSQSLYYLSSRLALLGNTPDVFALQLKKKMFFATLDRLNIVHPEVVFSSPDKEGDWLLKPMQGQGGMGIKRYRFDNSGNKLSYWQRFQAGRLHSVLFLADGRDMVVIGFNRQWSVFLSETQEFVFSGVMNSCDLSALDKAEIIGWLKQLVRVFGLKGLNSLDFIHLDGCSYVLEINPRPSASMQLYDQNLLSQHIQSSVVDVDVGATLVAQPMQTGYQVVYAERDIVIPDQFKWPSGCMDLPKPGNICHTGQPICSIIAREKESASVVKQLLAKQQLIIRKLERF